MHGCFNKILGKGERNLFREEETEDGGWKSGETQAEGNWEEGGVGSEASSGSTDLSGQSQASLQYGYSPKHPVVSHCYPALNGAASSLYPQLNKGIIILLSRACANRIQNN